MLKITNVSVGHLYILSDIMLRKFAQSYDSTKQ
jgi:hypothetical protein